MSISSISFSFFSTTGPATAATGVASTSPAANDAVSVPTQACESGGQSHGRRNVLYEAMMAALRELGLTAEPAPSNPVGGTPAPAPLPPVATPAPVAVIPTVPSPSPVTPTAVPATPADPAAPAAVSVEDAVFAFAHALWQAVRAAEPGDMRRQHHDGDDHEGHHGHRHHGHGHGDGFGMSRSYSGLATRLEALAVRMESNTGAVSSSPATTVANDSTSVAPPVEPAQAAVPASESVTAPAKPIPPGPLSQAFDAMMSVLRSINSNAPAAGAALPTLASFLHSLARGLSADRATSTMSGIGIVINISA